MPPALMMAIRNRLGGMQGAPGMPGAMPQPGAPSPMQLALFKRARAKKAKLPKLGV